MIELNTEHLIAYLKQTFGPDTELLSTGPIGSLDEQGMKDFGYGKPMLIKYRVRGQVREAVLSAMKGDKYGHQFYWDRAAILMFQYETSGRLERHAAPLAMGYVDAHNQLHQVKDVQDFFILNEKLEGHDYFRDLDRVRKGTFLDTDIEMTRQLSHWLTRIHGKKLKDADLYYRRVRESFGSSECIMGLIDEAFPHPYDEYPDERFLALAKRTLDWIWKLRKYTHRLSTVHGDFHPWNVLVNGEDFAVLDRSRGEWGEPADDLATMAMNYVLFGIYDSKHGPILQKPFLTLYTTLMEEYLQRTHDTEILEVIAPFFVFRGLVIASPEWYPDHPASVRHGLFRFMENVLEDAVFDYKNINKYFQET